MLKRKFALQSEARAEITSTKMEFYGILIIVVGLSAKMVIDPGADVSLSDYPLTAWVILGALAGWMVFGVVRFNRMMSTIEKETM